MLLILITLILTALGADFVDEETSKQELLALRVKKEADMTASKQELYEVANHRGNDLKSTNNDKK